MPLPKDILVQVRLSVDDTEISTDGCIRTCDQGVGNGIEFKDPGDTFCRILKAKLEQIQRAEDARKVG